MQGDMPFSTGPLILFVKFIMVVLNIGSIFVECVSERVCVKETECVRDCVTCELLMCACVLESGVSNSKYSS